MKFNNGLLDHEDEFGDKLMACACPSDIEDFLIIRTTGGRDVFFTLKEARKFAKAIRKQVKLAEMGGV